MSSQLISCVGELESVGIFVGAIELGLGTLEDVGKLVVNGQRQYACDCYKWMDE